MKNSIKNITKISKTLKLLYVEDDEDARTSTLGTLKNFFTDITTAVDGQDGLDTFHQDTFDLIISDINMPKLTGIEMLREIRETDIDTPVLILSAYNETNFFLETIKLGVDGYILKPLEHNQFLAALTKTVEKIHLRKKSARYQQHLEQEVQERTKELHRKLHYDDLTGLLSRYSFFEDIKDVPVPIIFIIDIDKFKIINEIYGNSTGSLVLKAFADFLTGFIKESTYRAYRLSGDEFILRDAVDHINPEKYEEDLDRFFKRLASFKVPLGDDSISLDATIGFSTSQQDAFESAKVALEYAKSHKKHFAMYSSVIDKRKEEQDALVWKDKIKSAIEEHRIVPVYQPIVNQSGETVKYETLMRLKEKESKKLISPYFFLDIAIKTRQYSALSTAIIFEALHLLNTSAHCLSFNLTYGDIKNSSLVNKIELFLKSKSNLGERIVFEITESESIENYDDVKDFIKRFRAYGVKIAIDDFGSGFSNFEYILEIHPDYLKIDGSLIKSIDTDEKSLILVRAIVQFSHELGIKVIAEYVHSETIFNMLKALHVDEYQGYYFSEPLENIGR